jgi:hypothetical protein
MEYRVAYRIETERRRIAGTAMKRSVAMQFAAVAAILVALIATLGYGIRQRDHDIADLNALSRLCGPEPAATRGTSKPPAIAATTPHSETKKPIMRWSRNEHAPSYETEWNLIGDDDYVYALVMKSTFDSSWSVFHNGAGFGEFATEAAAKREAEAVASRLGRNTA